MTELSKDERIERLARENARLYEENEALRRANATLSEENDELSRCIPVDPAKWGI